jgi:hypothetical protein
VYYSGKDGNARQLCVPSIAPVFRVVQKGSTIPLQRAPSRVTANPASREGGGGVTGRLDLKMVIKHGDIIDLTLLVGALRLFFILFLFMSGEFWLPVTIVPAASALIGRFSDQLNYNPRGVYVVPLLNITIRRFDLSFLHIIVVIVRVT